MNQQAPLHPLFVHMPLALAMLAPVLFGVLWLAIGARWLPLRTWTLAIAAQAALVGSGWLAMESGEEDVERVERVVAEAAIESHEQRAEWFVGAGLVVLLLSGAPLLAGRMPRVGAIAAYAVIAASVGVLGLAWAVGDSGGKLVYQHGAAAAWALEPTNGPAVARDGEREDH
jgi:uncharacterized membrane protein